MRARRNAVLVFSTLGAIFTAEMVAGQAVDQIVEAENRRIEQAQVAQNQIDGIVTETRSLSDEFRTVTKEVAGLLVYNTLLERQIADQEEELQSRVVAHDDLLGLVEEGGARDNAQEAQRIHELERDQDNQRQLLNEALAEKSREEARRDRLETTFEENELLIAGVTEQSWTPRPTTPILE